MDYIILPLDHPGQQQPWTEIQAIRVNHVHLKQFAIEKLGLTEKATMTDVRAVLAKQGKAIKLLIATSVNDL